MKGKYYMEKFINEFEITRELYCEALYKMIPAPRFVVYGIATILLLVSSLVMFLGNNHKTGIMWLVLGLTLGFYGFFGIKLKGNSFYKRNFASLCDKNGKFWRRTVFNDKNFKVTEPQTNATFKYSAIRAVNESKNLYVLVLESKQILFIKKGAFENASDSEFIDFLKEKCKAQ